VERLTGEPAARLNERVARLSVLTAATLGVLKLAAAIFTGSLAIVASLVDSFMDLLASSVNYLAVRWAGVPADEDHAYGHGKAEGLAGLVQGVVVAFSGLFLLVEGVRRVIEGWVVAHAELGVAVMVVSTAASAWISWLLGRTARRTGSVALAADRVHYVSDIWANLGVLVALVLIQVTGEAWIDGIVAGLVGLLILSTAVHVVRRSADELMDKTLPDTEVEAILAAVRQDVPEVRDVHDFRSRRAGPTVFVDLHVQLDRDLPFPKAHRLSEEVVRSIQRRWPGAKVTVHADPHPLLPEDLG
jgi:ferrous-iron efflux pump FieF